MRVCDGSGEFTCLSFRWLHIQRVKKHKRLDNTDLYKFSTPYIPNGWGDINNNNNSNNNNNNNNNNKSVRCVNILNSSKHLKVGHHLTARENATPVV